MCPLAVTPKGFPTRPLGLEQASPASRPLTSPSMDTLPGEDQPALPGLPAQHEQPEPSPGQVIPKAKEQPHEGATFTGLPLATWEASSLACLSPAQDSPQDWLQPWRWTSLPNLPVNHKAKGKPPPDISCEPERWVPCHSAPSEATPRATQAWPCNPIEAPDKGSTQPSADAATGLRTNPCPAKPVASAPPRTASSTAKAEPAQRPRSSPRAPHVSTTPTSESTGKLDAQRPPEGAVIPEVSGS